MPGATDVPPALSTSKRLKSGGIRDLRLDRLTHPLDRSMTFAFLVTLFFTILAIVSGVPVVIAISVLVPIGFVVKVLSSCYCYHNGVTWSRASATSALPPASFLTTSVPFTPLESYWLSDKKTNNHKFGVCNCLLFMDDTVRLDQLKDIVVGRLLSKPEYWRFSCKVTRRGLSRSPFWAKISPLPASTLDQVIFSELPIIQSMGQLRSRMVDISNQMLPPHLPLWQLRIIHLSFTNRVALVFRVHQSLCDGVGMMSILVSHLSDSPPSATTTFIRTCHGTMTAASSMFKPRFGGINFSINICRAMVVGPLTFVLWLWWAVSKRNYNFLKNQANDSKVRIKNKEDLKTESVSSQADPTSEKEVTSNGDNHECIWLKKRKTSDPKGMSYPTGRSLYFTSIDLSKVYRIKQITRTCINDVILAAVSGAVREYLVKECGAQNPPDLTVSIPVDVRGLNESDSGIEGPGVAYVLLTSPLPINTEGSIPRLWEIRHLMEEMKASADPAVMYGVQYFLSYLVPGCIARAIFNFIHRNSSINISNLQGPVMEVTVGTHRLHSLYYWMSCPPPVAVSFNVISYHQKLHVSISTTSALIPCARTLSHMFVHQVDTLSCLLSKRRVPGESRKKNRPHHVVIEAPIGSGRKHSIPSGPGSSGPSTSSACSSTMPSHLQVSIDNMHDQLNNIQMEINSLNDAILSDSYSDDERDNFAQRMELLKEEFSLVMKNIRRKKSMAELGSISSTLQIDSFEDEDLDEDIDGELRCRRYSYKSRRTSVVSTALGLSASSMKSISPFGQHHSPHPPSSPEVSSPDFIVTTFDHKFDSKDESVV